MFRVPGSSASLCGHTPYAVSFKAGESTFILVTLHITFGDPTTERIPELIGLAR